MAKGSTGQAASQKQLILVGVMFAVLLGVVYFMFLKGDGEEPATSATPAPAGETEPAEDEPTDKNEKDEAQPPKKKASKGPVETTEVFGGKDPFEPVIDLTPVAAAAAGRGDATTDGTTTTTDDGSTTTPTAPTVPTTPVQPVTPPPDDDDDDDDVVKTGYVVRLVDVFSDNGTRTAHVQTVKRASWDKQQHPKLTAGDRFRKHFKITSIDNRCATFMFDQEWFSLCEGQRVIRK
jgi:cytoskeletal protein RodZ